MSLLERIEGAVQVSLEATGCFMWVYDLLVERLDKAHVHVAAPSKVSAIANSSEKNDANDAWWLAYLLYECRLPEAFVAQGDLRELRIACREYRDTVNRRSDAARRLKSHLAQLGVKPRKSDMSSMTGRQRVAALVAEAVAEHGMRGQAVLGAWELFVYLDAQADAWEQRIDAMAAALPQVQTLADELPGIGKLLAAIVHSELGDPARYKSAKAFAKATGLTPGYRESGGHRSGMPITRMGSAHVRWALTRAMVACLRCKRGAGLAVRQWLEKRFKRKNKRTVIVAGARKLAESIWRMMRLGEAFDLTRCFNNGQPVKTAT